MKRLAAPMLLTLFLLSCKKDKDITPKKVQDIRGTEWISEYSVGTTYPGGSVYMKLDFISGSDLYSGSGKCTFQLKDGTLVGYSDMKWSLDYGQDPKNKTQITIKYDDWDDESKTKTGSWVIGSLFIDGVSYSKE